MFAGLPIPRQAPGIPIACARLWRRAPRTFCSVRYLCRIYSQCCPCMCHLLSINSRRLLFRLSHAAKPFVIRVVSQPYVRCPYHLALIIPSVWDSFLFLPFVGYSPFRRIVCPLEGCACQIQCPHGQLNLPSRCPWVAWACSCVSPDVPVQRAVSNPFGQLQQW